MPFELPELDSELKDELSLIIDNKTFDPSASKLNWETGILPKLIGRLDQLSQLSQQGNRYGKPKDIDLPETIDKINETIKQHLASNMKESPPFTIYRIAEIILDPNNQGYNLIDNDQLFKYFNSLKKVFIVSSTVDEFPPVELSKEEEDDDTKTIPQVANNISLVEIPWLKKDGVDTASVSQKRKDQEATDDKESNKKAKN
ncbi:hypothetical protein Cantr_03528 [Candida viswanathii]|uniref:Uncharacterized protein n=1 Tax=Candida viswanathii TaxID=5486 RepID=A0A367YNC9_9ASCO|nr:hypothetical protein Cantr_00489 [Candida viswanathii]RCK66512.1 hypothetical protein Cantr_03528 [Candida viswanathii]